MLESAWSSGAPPGESIGWVRTNVNSVTPTSYDDLKGTGEDILLILHLRVVLAIKKMSDNVMILTEDTMEVGELE